jgi:histone H3/H4
MADNLIVKSNVKAVAKADGEQLNVSGDFADALNAKAIELVEAACKRAKANGRSTVMVKDL